MAKLHLQLTELKVANMYDLIYADSSDRKIADSLHIKLWQKTDFNNDGQTDLLVYGIDIANPFLLAVICDKDKYSVKYLTLSYFPPTYFPVIKKDEFGVALLMYQRERSYAPIRINDSVEAHSLGGRPTSKLSCTKLIYKFDNFIEPNESPVNHIIRNITFSTDGCFGTCPVYTLSINSNREAIYQPKMYCSDTGTFYAIIDTTSYNLTIALLNSTNFPVLLDKYSVEWTDDDTCYLTISYDNDKEKKIEDYGKQGTCGLAALYAELSKLRKTQKWKKNK